MQLSLFQLRARGRLQANRAVSKLNMLLAVMETADYPPSCQEHSQHRH